MVNTAKDCDVPPTRVTELKFAKDQGLCTTLSYVAFTDHKKMIGDAMPIQNTAFDASRLFADPIFLERLLLAPCCCLSGQWTCDWRCTANPENTVLTTAEVTDLIAGVGLKAYDQGNRTTLNLSPFTDNNRVWSWRIWLPRVSRIWQWTWVIASAWRSGATFTSATTWAPTRFWINTYKSALVRPQTRWSRILVVPTTTSQSRRTGTRRWYRGPKSAWIYTVICWSKHCDNAETRPHHDPNKKTKKYKWFTWRRIVSSTASGREWRTHSTSTVMCSWRTWTSDSLSRVCSPFQMPHPVRHCVRTTCHSTGIDQTTCLSRLFTI